MKLFFKLSILFITLCTLITACDESDKFSTNPNLGLEFSRDTLRFDTVFTTMASPMQSMKIRNRNNNSISFESIELMNPEKSGFRINVDGWAGTKFENIDILRKDSLYIVVDAKPNEATSNKNTLIRDSIRIQWNGNIKYIQLGAYGVNVHIWDDKNIDTDTQLTSEKGYYIRGALTINEGATLSIAAGTTFYMDKKASITINGTIKASGTPQKPIVFRGHRFDLIERNIPYDNASDQWRGISVGENSFNNILENVRIRNSQWGIDFAKSTPTQKKATLTNTVVHNTSEFGIKAINSNIEATNCQITNSRGGLLQLAGGNYSFLHCTIANYYAWHPRTTPCVILEETSGNTKYPLTKCEFTNSIIAGNFKDELNIFVDKEGDTSYLFYNCVIQASKVNADSRYVNTTWNITSPFLFKNLSQDKRFYYSFELPEGSSAINSADILKSTLAPTDLRGISRLIDTKPDIGCYEWTH